MFLFFNINIIICLRTAPVEMFTVYHTLTYIHVCVCVCVGIVYTLRVGKRTMMQLFGWLVVYIIFHMRPHKIHRQPSASSR